MEVRRGILIDEIRKCYPFNKLGDSQISELIDHSKVLFFEKDDLIFQEGSTANHLYLLLEGTASLLIAKNGKTTAILNHKTEGGICGEEVLLKTGRRLSSLKADDNLMILKIPKKYLEALMIKEPMFAKGLQVLVQTYKNLVKSKSNLTTDECIYYLGNPHPFFYVRGIIIPLVVALGLVYAMTFLKGWESLSNSSMILWASIIIFITIFYAIWKYIEWQRHLLAITQKRIFSHATRLLKNETKMDTPLNTIMNISLIKPLVGKIFNFAHLSVETYTGKNLVLAVPMAEQVQELLEFLIFNARSDSEEQERAFFRKILMEKHTPPTLIDSEPIESFTSNQKKLEKDSNENASLVYRTHWLILLKKVLLPTLFFLAIILIFIFLYANSLVSSENTAMLILPFALLSFSAVWWLYQFFDWYNDRYIILNDQIFDINKKPFGREERRSASIFNIQSIRFEKSGLAGILFNFGTVYIRIGDEEFTFDQVPNPAEVQRTIYQALQSALSGKKRKELTEQQLRIIDLLEAYEEFKKEQGEQAK